MITPTINIVKYFGILVLHGIYMILFKKLLRQN